MAPDRIVYVYRLVIAYPPGSLKPGWKPACWEDLLAGIADKRQRAAVRRRGFRWPRERLFLSSSGAYGRANLLMWFGAQVDVQQSEEVTWWEDIDAMEWQPDPTGAASEPGTAAPLKPDMAQLMRDHAEFYATFFEDSR